MVLAAATAGLWHGKSETRACCGHNSTQGESKALSGAATCTLLEALCTPQHPAAFLGVSAKHHKLLKEAQVNTCTWDDPPYFFLIFFFLYTHMWYLSPLPIPSWETVASCN